MKNKAIAAALAAAMAGALPARAADVQVYEDPGERGGVRIGTLHCDIDGGLGYVLGSAKEVNCSFRSAHGSADDSYAGVIRKLGIDVGFTTHGRLVWAVFAPTAGYHRGSLAGRYRGATAEATVFLGAGANVLVGGTTGSVHLQLVSLTGQRGLNLAATGTSMTLNPVN